MLTKEKMEVYRSAESIFNREKQVILDEIDRVFSVIAKFFGGKVEYWWFDGAAEGQVGEIDMCGDGSISFCEVRGKIKGNMEDYLNPLPGEFLYMTNEEIIASLQKDKEEEDARKIKKKSKQKEVLQIRKDALAKLNKEERRALGVK